MAHPEIQVIMMFYYNGYRFLRYLKMNEAIGFHDRWHENT